MIDIGLGRKGHRKLVKLVSMPGTKMPACTRRNTRNLKL